MDEYKPDEVMTTAGWSARCVRAFPHRLFAIIRKWLRWRAFSSLNLPDFDRSWLRR